MVDTRQRFIHSTRGSIINCDIAKYLLEKYFPETLPEWKGKLHSIGKELQNEKIWCAYQGKKSYGEFDKAYRYTNHHLKIVAETFGNNELLTQSKGVRVTDFTKWVWTLCYLQLPNPSSLARGKHIERSIARLAKPSDNPDWELVYRDPLECAPAPLKISSLTFNDEPLWGAPDLVYRNKVTGELIIVERKASDKKIPVNGWPNLKAQLWAYSHIYDFKSAPVISLIGEVWDISEERLSRRAVLRWSCKQIKNSTLKTWSFFRCLVVFVMHNGRTIARQAGVRDEPQRLA